MEVSGYDFLEELLALRREAWDTIPSPNEENRFFFPSAYNSLDCFDPNSFAFLPNSFSDQQLPQNYNNHSTFNEIYSSLLDEFSAPQIIDSSPPYTTLDTTTSLSPPSFPVQEENNPFSSMMEEEGLFGEEFQSLDLKRTCKREPISHSPEMPVFNMGTCNLEGKNRPAKKLLRQPSKNLMAERRRRKRLNDRLSMLRSIVPKISKMDRTSILGDTIDYMKELLEKIKDLQQEIDLDSNMVGVLKDARPNEITARNSPKFDVERRNVDTRVEICCAGKPGLLLSAVNTLEAFGLEIQQCVISCFNDFTMQASCSEELEHRTILGSGDIKQALFRSAGYGGRCL
ncbi:transcription factor bHLH93-like [Neltuma alba]|uniref:transcription factor bHLH93-like n=1 Tax=Neltuma alba TaxID=207710 RepID=UPI0010A39B0A|nr:transcription factor bHLH93-like [Prosopis alba]XP_028791928.1 transcription factor bHLH93-like [Prosopis alba]